MVTEILKKVEEKTPRTKENLVHNPLSCAIGEMRRGANDLHSSSSSCFDNRDQSIEI